MQYTAKTNDFFQNVFDVVRLIPKGRVTSYGAIAKYLGTEVNECPFCLFLILTKNRGLGLFLVSNFNEIRHGDKFSLLF